MVQAADAFQKIGQPHPVFARLGEARQAYQAAQQDRAAAARYEAAFAEALAVFEARLTNFVQRRAEFEEAYQDFVQTSEANRTALAAEQQAHEAAAEAELQRAETALERQQELGDKFAVLLESDQPLPAEVARVVREAEVRKKAADLNRRVWESHAKKAAARAGQLQSALQAVSQRRDDAELAFITAEENIDLLHALVESRGSQASWQSDQSHVQNILAIGKAFTARGWDQAIGDLLQEGLADEHQPTLVFSNENNDADAKSILRRALSAKTDRDAQLSTTASGVEK